MASTRFFRRADPPVFLILTAALIGLSACGSRTEGAAAAGFGGFEVDAETCVANHPAGIALQAFTARRPALRVTVATEQTGPLRLMVGDRPVLVTTIAPVSGQAGATFDDAVIFWSAFGQADRMIAADVEIPVADQAALRRALTACAPTIELAQ